MVYSNPVYNMWSFRLSVLSKLTSCNLFSFRSLGDPATYPEVSVVSSLHRGTPEVCRGWQLQVSFVSVIGTAGVVVFTLMKFPQPEGELFQLWTLLKVSSSPLMARLPRHSLKTVHFGDKTSFSLSHGNMGVAVKLKGVNAQEAGWKRTGSRFHLSPQGVPSSIRHWWLSQAASQILCSDTGLAVWQF